MMTTLNDGEAEKWRSALLSPGATVQDAVRNLEATGLQIVLVVDDAGKLCGTVTDGDVRRGLLRGLSLSDAVARVLHREPLVVTPQVPADAVLHIMQANRIHQLPIVDGERRLVGLHLWAALVAPDRRENVMVIMAGGRGRRLHPHTDNCPKPMLPVGGKPMLQHIVERARGEGFHRFVLTTHYLGHMIEEYFGDGSAFQVEIDYVREGAPLGTAGALGLLSPRPTSPFLVTNGDVLTDVRYAELLQFHLQHGAAATMAVRQHEWQHPFGVVRTRGVDIVAFEEKPISRTHINAGVYALEPAALDVLEPGEHCDMPTLFERLQKRESRTIAYPMHELWIDVGRADDLIHAHTLRPQEAAK